jgi:hypothetical protein
MEERMNAELELLRECEGERYRPNLFFSLNPLLPTIPVELGRYPPFIK